MAAVPVLLYPGRTGGYMSVHISGISGKKITTGFAEGILRKQIKIYYRIQL